jgi:hypothetical protein
VTNAGNLRPLGGAVAVVAAARPTGPLWSAKIALRTGGREEVFVMQPAKDRIGTDGVRFSATMSRKFRPMGRCVLSEILAAISPRLLCFVAPSFSF